MQLYLMVFNGKENKSGMSLISGTKKDEYLELINTIANLMDQTHRSIYDEGEIYFENSVQLLNSFEFIPTTIVDLRKAGIFDVLMHKGGNFGYSPISDLRDMLKEYEFYTANEEE